MNFIKKNGLAISVVILIIWIVAFFLVFKTEANNHIVVIDGGQHWENVIKPIFEDANTNYELYSLETSYLEKRLAEARSNQASIVVVEFILNDDRWFNEVNLLCDSGTMVLLPSGWSYYGIHPVYQETRAIIVGAVDVDGHCTKSTNCNNVDVWIRADHTSGAVARQAILIVDSN